MCSQLVSTLYLQHFHSDRVEMVCVSGAFTLVQEPSDEDQDVELELKPGDYCVLSPKVAHALRCTAPGTLWCAFPGALDMRAVG